DQPGVRVHLERDLAKTAYRVLPERDHSRRRSPRGPRPLHEAERGEGDHGGPGVVGEDARVACRPSRGQLRAVEEDRHHEGRPDGPKQVGHLVEAGQILADDRYQGDALGQFNDLHGSPGHRHGLPPPHPRRERASQVVLLDLVVVEGPAMVLVLAVAPPAPPEPDAEMQPVGAETTAGARWLTYSGDDEPDVVTAEDPLELVDVAWTDHALGEDDDLDRTHLVPRRLEDPVSQVQIQHLAWCELKEASRLESGVLDGPDRLEV